MFPLMISVISRSRFTVIIPIYEIINNNGILLYIQLKTLAGMGGMNLMNFLVDLILKFCQVTIK